MFSLQKEEAINIVKNFNDKFSEQTCFNLYLMGNYSDYRNLGIHLNQNEYMKDKHQFVKPNERFTALLNNYFEENYNIEIVTDYYLERDCGYILFIRSKS